MTNQKSKPNSPTSTLLDSRRRFIKWLSVLPLGGFARALLAQSTAPNPISLAKLHSFGIRVSDISRSIDFYQAVFGASIQARQNDKVILRIGDGPQFSPLSKYPLEKARGYPILALGLKITH